MCTRPAPHLSAPRPARITAPTMPVAPPRMAAVPASPLWKFRGRGESACDRTASSSSMQCGARSASGSRPRASTRSAPHVDATWSGNTPPPYPGMARRLGDQGEVRLDVHVGADGRVTEVRLKQSSGSTLLDRTAMDTVKKWRFKPATVDGRPVAEWYHDWRWVFRLEG